jgi:hypothetical protein
MKRIAVLTLVLASVAAAQDYRDVNKTLALPANGLVEIENHKGSINVSVWDRHEVEIQARIEAVPGEPMDRRRFDATEVHIESSSDSVQIKTYYFEFNGCCSFNDTGTNPEVRYTVKMPKTARLTIRDHRSTTEVVGLQGALDFSTDRGIGHIRGLGGALHLDTHRGDIEVDFSSFTAASSIKTERGTVELSMPKTSRFNLEADLGRKAGIDTDFTVMARTISRHGGGVQGAANGGGPVLHIESERGEIRLKGK